MNNELVGHNKLSGADPGFHVGGDADRRGAPTYDFVIFSQKLHEIEKIMGRRRGRAVAPPLDPPLFINHKIMIEYTVLNNHEQSNKNSNEIII